MERHNENLQIRLPSVAHCTNIYRIKLNASPYTSAIPGNEQSSDLYEMIWLVRDAASGRCIDTIRQGDRRLVTHQILVGADDVGARSTIDLVLVPTMPWQCVQEPAIALAGHTTALLPGHVSRIDIQFGAPFDTWFFGDNWSYSEGADARGTWFHCKRFRWTNNEFELLVPLVRGARQILQLNASASVAFRVTEADGARHDFRSSRGGRWHQDDYRMELGDHLSSVVDGVRLGRVVVSALDPLPGLQADLRELFMGVESAELEVLSDRPAQPFRVVDALNAGLQRDPCPPPADDLAATQFNLLRGIGSVGLRNEAMPPPPGLNRIVDCVVFVDSFHDLLAQRRLETGAVWLNSAVGAALALEQLGLSVRYGGLAEIEQWRPSLVVVPSQAALTDLGPDGLDRLTAPGRVVVIEAGFNREMVADSPIADRFGWKLSGDGEFVLRDDWKFADGTMFPELWKTFIHFLADGSRHEVLLTAGHRRYPLCVQSREEPSAYLLMGLFFFNFYNYGLHSHIDVLAKLLFEICRFRPRVRLFSPSRVWWDAYGADGGWNIVGRNSNAGLFAYHGIGRAFPVRAAEGGPPIGEVTIEIVAAAGAVHTVRLSGLSERFEAQTRWP